jgi:hypothetical protein
MRSPLRVCAALLVLAGLAAGRVRAEGGDVSDAANLIADQKIRVFEHAVQSGDPAAIQKAAVDLRTDNSAVKRLNNSGRPDLIDAHRTEMNRIVEGTEALSKQGIADTYNRQRNLNPGDKGYARPADVTFDKFTNPKKPGAAPKTGFDTDMTPRVHGEDFVNPEVEGVIKDSFRKAAGGDKTFGNKSAAEAAKGAKVEVIERFSPDAYERTPEAARKTLGGGDAADPRQVAEAAKHKVGAEFREAEGLRQSGDAPGAHNAEVKGFHEAAKQYKNLVEPTVQSKGGQVPEHVRKGMEIIEQVESGALKPAEGAEKLRGMGETPESMSRKAMDLIEAAPVLEPKRPPALVTPETPPPAAGKPPGIVLPGEPAPGARPGVLVDPQGNPLTGKGAGTAPKPTLYGGDGKPLVPAEGPLKPVLVDPRGRPLTTEPPPPAPPRRMIGGKGFNLKPPPTIETPGATGGRGGAPKAPPVVKAPLLEAVPPAGGGKVPPTFRSTAFTVAGVGLLIYGAVTSIADGWTQARQEQEASGGKQGIVMTGVKTVGYSVYNFFARPFVHAAQSGSAGGTEAMTEYNTHSAQGGSSLWYPWYKGKALVYGFGNFSGVKPAYEEYKEMSAAGEQAEQAEQAQSDMERALDEKKTAAAINKTLSGLEKSGLPLFPTEAGVAGGAVDLRGLEPAAGGFAGGTPSGDAPLDGFVNGTQIRQTEAGKSGFAVMTDQTKLSGASSADSGKLDEAGYARDRGGRDARKVLDDTNREINEEAREQSWGKAMADALQQSIEAGVSAFGAALGDAAATEATRALFPHGEQPEPEYGEGGGTGAGEGGDTEVTPSESGAAPASPRAGKSTSKSGTSSKHKVSHGGSRSSSCGASGTSGQADYSGAKRGAAKSGGQACTSCGFRPMKRMAPSGMSSDIQYILVCPKCGKRISVYKEALGPAGPAPAPKAQAQRCPRCGAVYREATSDGELYEARCANCGWSPYGDDRPAPPPEPKEPEQATPYLFWTCPKCGQTYEKDVRSCPTCGKAAPPWTDKKIIP